MRKLKERSQRESQEKKIIQTGKKTLHMSLPPLTKTIFEQWIKTKVDKFSEGKVSTYVSTLLRCHILSASVKIPDCCYL